MNYWKSVMLAVKSADVVLFILDARMPELSRNIDLEEKLKRTGKKSLLVFNKIDLISERMLKELKNENPEAFFISCVYRIGIKDLRTRLQIISKEMKFEKLEIGIVGYPNVGKSAITNILSRGNKSKVSSRAGTTKGLHWASSNTFKILDSPGVIPFDDSEVKLGILGAKNPDKLQDPDVVAMEIIKIFENNNIQEIEKLYGVTHDKDEDEYDFFLKIGNTRKIFKKGGVVDENRVAYMIINDWNSGKLKLRGRD